MPASLYYSGGDKDGISGTGLYDAAFGKVCQRHVSGRRAVHLFDAGCGGNLLSAWIPVCLPPVPDRGKTIRRKRTRRDFGRMPGAIRRGIGLPGTCLFCGETAWTDAFRPCSPDRTLLQNDLKRTAKRRRRNPAYGKGRKTDRICHLWML